MTYSVYFSNQTLALLAFLVVFIKTTKDHGGDEVESFSEVSRILRLQTNSITAQQLTPHSFTGIDPKQLKAPLDR